MKQEILKAFLYKDKLKFSEIEKHIGERSNKLSYHIKNLTQNGILQKEGEYYTLTNQNEQNIPYFSDQKSPLPVILIAITNEKGQTHLITRNKRPFKDKLGLPGGRLLTSESIEEGTMRIAKKWNIKAEFQKVYSVSLEHVIKEDKKMHSFLLILVKATTTSTLNYVNIDDKKDKIIESDYHLLKSDLQKEVALSQVFTPN